MSLKPRASHDNGSTAGGPVSQHSSSSRRRRRRTGAAKPTTTIYQDGLYGYNKCVEKGREGKREGGVS